MPDSSSINEQIINDTFRKFYKARQEWAQAVEKTASFRSELAQKYAELLIKGSIEGRNEEYRSAKARKLIPEHYQALEMAEHHERQAKLNFDLARIEVDRLDYLLRFLTVSTPES